MKKAVVSVPLRMCSELAVQLQGIPTELQIQTHLERIAQYFSFLSPRQQEREGDSPDPQEKRGRSELI
jgi:hypothetical protein